MYIFLPASGQKPFPCQKCDAFFSTKSNCERHQLRKHGVTACSPRRNGLIPPRESDVGPHDSTGSAQRTENLSCARSSREGIASPGPRHHCLSPAPLLLTGSSPERAGLGWEPHPRPAQPRHSRLTQPEPRASAGAVPCQQRLPSPGAGGGR